jgi:hypothetical protein
MNTLPLGVFWGLRRLADDGGRFMLLDLTGAEADVLAELLTGLAPFATGVVLESAPGRTVWCRCATPLIGRVEVARDARDVAAAKRVGADAVLAPEALGGAAADAEIARIGADHAADLALIAGAAGPWLVATDGDTAPLERAGAGAAGHLLAAAFWRDALTGLTDAAARRLAIADDLAPRVQALNALTADLPPGMWLDL